MALYRRGQIYWFGFVFNGERIQESTKQRNRKVALDIEATYRSALAKGELGIVEKKPAPTLAEFLKKQFLPYADTAHAQKPATLRYYKTGAASLTDSNLAGLTLDRINNEHARQYEAKLKKLSPSTVNCGLRCLRRSLNLAFEWGVISGRSKISLAKGERQRERVLTDAEIGIYLGACEQPWKDCATIMLGTGMRPGEVFELRWEHVHLNGSGGLMQITEGKSKAARRILPMVPAVYQTLKARHRAEGKPERGWTFPAETKSGHLEGHCAKNQHAAALLAIKTAAEEEEIENPVRPFPPYTMRHTALTRLAESGCDAFTLARIAGHSSITITQRYCHPQAEAIERAFSHYSSHYTQEMPLLPSSEESAATSSMEKR
jgi:integrase